MRTTSICSYKYCCSYFNVSTMFRNKQSNSDIEFLRVAESMSLQTFRLKLEDCWDPPLHWYHPSPIPKAGTWGHGHCFTRYVKETNGCDLIHGFHCDECKNHRIWLIDFEAFVLSFSTKQSEQAAVATAATTATAALGICHEWNVTIFLCPPCCRNPVPTSKTC